VRSDCEVVVLFCDFRNRVVLAKEHMPQDMLYVLTLYIDALGKAIRTAHRMLSRLVAVNALSVRFQDSI
jgi:hypothetical protein